MPKLMTYDEFMSKTAEWTKAAEREAKRLGFTFLDHGHDKSNQLHVIRVSIGSELDARTWRAALNKT